MKKGLVLAGGGAKGAYHGTFTVKKAEDFHRALNRALFESFFVKLFVFIYSYLGLFVVQYLWRVCP